MTLEFYRDRTSTDLLASQACTYCTSMNLLLGPVTPLTAQPYSIYDDKMVHFCTAGNTMDVLTR